MSIHLMVLHDEQDKKLSISPYDILMHREVEGPIEEGGKELKLVQIMFRNGNVISIKDPDRTIFDSIVEFLHKNSPQEGEEWKQF